MFTPPGSTFKLFFYQRIFLRVAMRHRYCYATFTRAFSKSFLSILLLIIRCILFPGAKWFVASAGKEQAANIAKEKIEELIDLMPALSSEIDWRPGKSQFAKDYVKIQFKNGSRLDIVAIRESTRGGRRHGGVIEEVVLVDGDKLNSVVLPLMNVSRRASNGYVDPDETLNKSQIYLTTKPMVRIPVMICDKPFNCGELLKGQSAAKIGQYTVIVKIPSSYSIQTI
jgi:hypothetical protein